MSRILCFVAVPFTLCAADAPGGHHWVHFLRGVGKKNLPLNVAVQVGVAVAAVVVLLFVVVIMMMKMMMMMMMAVMAVTLVFVVVQVLVVAWRYHVTVPPRPAQGSALTGSSRALPAGCHHHDDLLAGVAHCSSFKQSNISAITDILTIFALRHMQILF
jgi:hypothetical protein